MQSAADDSARQGGEADVVLEQVAVHLREGGRDRDARHVDAGDRRLEVRVAPATTTRLEGARRVAEPRERVFPVSYRFDTKDRAQMVCGLMRTLFRNNPCIWRHLPCIARLVRRGDATLDAMWSFIRLNCNVTKASLRKEIEKTTKLYLSVLASARVKVPRSLQSLSSSARAVNVGRSSVADRIHTRTSRKSLEDACISPCHACEEFFAQVKCVDCLNLRFCAGCVRHTRCKECAAKLAK